MNETREKMCYLQLFLSSFLHFVFLYRYHATFFHFVNKTIIRFESNFLKRLISSHFTCIYIKTNYLPIVKMKILFILTVDKIK